MPNLTGKTIGQLTTLTGITIDTLFAVELSGITYNIPFSTITQTLSGGIEIPRPEISISASQGIYGTCQDLYAHYLPTTNNTFLNYNPKYYLFIQKSRNNSIKKDINGNKYRKKKPSGIFHPTHQNGINFPNGAFYGGTTQIPLDTEFDIINPTPYIKTLINMNPLQFVRYNATYDPNNWVVPTLGDFPAPIWAFKIGGKRKPKGRSFLMYLAIGIENPDTSSNFPIIFGQLSIPFKLALKKEKDIVYSGNTEKAVVGVQYLINSSSVKIKNLL